LIDVSWFELTSADLAAEDDWLSASEAIRLSGMRFAKRRTDWRLGRWTAKRAVSLYLNLPVDPRSLARMEIRPAPSGAPEVFLGNEPAPVTISISHREGRAACAVGQAVPPAVLLLGCDLEIVEPRSDAFAADYFTAEEQELLAQASPADRLWLLALLWSGKESVLKALRVGLRLDTRCVAVDPFVGQVPGGSDWRPLRAHHNGQVLSGWWRQTGNLVRTMVAVPAPAAPLTFQM
jgi:4'-phosphopantetheinyl transferase